MHNAQSNQKYADASRVPSTAGNSDLDRLIRENMQVDPNGPGDVVSIFTGKPTPPADPDTLKFFGIQGSGNAQPNALTKRFPALGRIQPQEAFNSWQRYQGQHPWATGMGTGLATAGGVLALVEMLRRREEGERRRMGMPLALMGAGGLAMAAPWITRKLVTNAMTSALTGK